LPREAGEVDRDAAQRRTGQVGQARGRCRHLLGKDPLATVAEIHREQQLDGEAGGGSAERASRVRIGEDDPVRGLRDALDLVGLRRADDSERRQGVRRQTHQRRQAALGEPAAACFQHRLAHGRLAVHRLGDADQLEACGQKSAGDGPRGGAYEIGRDGELRVHAPSFLAVLPVRQAARGRRRTGRRRRPHAQAAPPNDHAGERDQTPLILRPGNALRWWSGKLWRASVRIARQYTWAVPRR